MPERNIDSIFGLETIEEIGSATKMCLYNAGFKSIKDLVIRGPIEIANATGIDMEKCSMLCNKARKILEDLGVYDKPFVPATIIYERRKSESRIPTGSSNLDELLDGGIENESITEIYGEFGTGKTQICHTLCVTLQSMSNNEKNKTLYIDTENTFRPERIVSISKARKLNPDRILENIIVARAYNSSHQEVIIDESPHIIELHNVGLLIIDSIMSHYRAEFIGRAYLSERQQRINKILHILLRIAGTCKIPVIITNQIQSSPDSIFGDPSKPTGGNIMAHGSTYRIYLKRSGKNRIARIADSPYHSERESLFSLTEQGIGDPQ